MVGRHLKWGAGAGTAFVLGVVAGLVVKETAPRMWDTARRRYAHRKRARTVAFDQNLPDSLERREPQPAPGQPRFGGTGAIGFSPVVVEPPSE